MATYKEMKTIKFPDSDVVYVITDDSKISKDQGSDNAGKVLYVDNEGLVTLIDAKNLETEIPEGILTYMEQDLTDEQKLQARTNIGASSFSGSYNDLTDKPTVSSVDVDSELSSSSTNPVQNKVIYNELNKCMASSDYDPNNDIKNAGGIAAWITANYDNAEEMSY